MITIDRTMSIRRYRPVAVAQPPPVFCRPGVPTPAIVMPLTDCPPIGAV